MIIKNLKDEELFCDASTTVSKTLEAAVRRHANLIGADLSGAYLRHAYLRGADLSGAYLIGANLIGADLSGANLSGAYLRHAYLIGADLIGANLSGASLIGANLIGANLIGADLSHAYLSGAYLSGANLSGANLRGADLSGAYLSGANLRYVILNNDFPVIPSIHSAVYAAAARPNALNMGDWHTCATTHCRAGWVVTLAGDAGRMLESALGTPTAAALIYIASDPSLERVPDFYCENEEALEDMKRLAEQKAASA